MMNMTQDRLVKALQQYDIRRRELDPVRYEALADFRDYMPELYPEMGPPPMGDDAPKDGGMPKGGPPGMNENLSRIMQALLAGESVENEKMQQELGFTYDQLLESVQAADPVKKAIPRGLVLMTFDDSTIDHYTLACPVLEKYGGKAVLFTTEMESPMGGGNGFWDKTRFMTWSQIKELSDRGHEIANHSWHHPVNLYAQSDDEILKEVHGIDQRCAEYGIPKPITFGYPGGGCTRHMEALLRAEGYRWGRGELTGPEKRLKGSAPYDPYLDTPMIVPNVAAMDEAGIKTLLNATESGKVLLMVKHQVDGSGMMQEPMPFEDQIKAIYDNGGQCITFRDLEEYIDPEKAYIYTH
jgi:peptidoglycan/xylan/chitin deacetylase (PgdA/CDA1 family)